MKSYFLGVQSWSLALTGYTEMQVVTHTYPQQHRLADQGVVRSVRITIVSRPGIFQGLILSELTGTRKMELTSASSHAFGNAWSSGDSPIPSKHPLTIAGIHPSHSELSQIPALPS